MRLKGKKTRYPGVEKIDDSTYRIRAKVNDPRRERPVEIDRVLTGVTPQEAARQRAELIAQIKAGNTGGGERQTVGAFAQLWMRSKTSGLDAGTAERYATALDLHILPPLGGTYYDALTAVDVQEWANNAFTKINPKTNKVYGSETAWGWWKILRAMTRDALDQLDLARDPTRRIIIPERPEKRDNSTSLEKLKTFLGIMRERFPRHYAFAAVRAFTGMRACHASALQWPEITWPVKGDDGTERDGIIRPVRKQIEGVIGPISKKKRTPKEFPLEPMLADMLREHRQRMLAKQAPGVESGWVFPSVRAGKLRGSNSMSKAWKKCCELAGITEHFTPHGLRRVFYTMLRRSGVDPTIQRALTGHVTEGMRDRYADIDIGEKRAAVASAMKLFSGGASGDRGGDAGKAANDGQDPTPSKAAK